jgi:hypothetical protein
VTADPPVDARHGELVTEALTSPDAADAFRSSPAGLFDVAPDDTRALIVWLWRRRVAIADAVAMLVRWGADPERLAITVPPVYAGQADPEGDFLGIPVVRGTGDAWAVEWRRVVLGKPAGAHARIELP